MKTGEEAQDSEADGVGGHSGTPRDRPDQAHGASGLQIGVGEGGKIETIQQVGGRRG